VNLQTAIQIGTLISVIVGFSGLVLGLYSYRRQMTVQILMKYTERYEGILDGFPEVATKYRFDPNALPPQSAELTLSVLKYLNLCSEEFYLRKRGYLPKDVWQIWEGDILRMLGDELVRREWEVLRPQFLTHPSFLQYVETAQAARVDPQKQKMRRHRRGAGSIGH
jgi:hypothetical protein